VVRDLQTIGQAGVAEQQESGAVVGPMPAAEQTTASIP